MCSQIHEQIKHSVAYLQDIIPAMAGVITYIFITAKSEIKSCRWAREYFIFVHALGYIIIWASSDSVVCYSYIAVFLADSSWLLVSLLFIAISTSFLKFDFYVSSIY